MRLILLAIVVVLAGRPGLAMAAPAPAPVDDPVEQLLAEATMALRRDASDTFRLVNQALGLLATRPDADHEFRARLLLCDYYSERNLAALEQQVEIMRALQPSLKRQGLRAGLLGCRGESHEMRGEAAEAFSLYDQAVSIATSTQDDEMLAAALYSRGFINSLQGRYAQGLSDLRQAQRLYEGVGLPLNALNAMNGIAIAYNRMGDSTQAIEIYSRALEIERQEGLKRDAAVTAYNIGRAAERMSDWGTAQRSFESALHTSQELAYARGQAYALRGLGAVALARGNTQAALERLQQARTLQQSGTDQRLEASISLTEAVARRALGQNSAARELLTSALEVFRDAGAQSELVTVYEQLALVDSGLGDWRRAFQWQEAAKQTSSQLLRNQIDQRFAVLKIEFDTATREKEYDALLQQSLANQRLLEQGRRTRNLQYVVLGLAVMLVALLATLAFRHNRSSRRMRHLALTDDLTEVPNRRAVLSTLTPLLAAGTPQVSVVLVDIDHFKRINDTFGHAAGDRVLKMAAERLRERLEPGEFLGRIGGEEFLLVLPGMDLATAAQRAETLRRHLTATDVAQVASAMPALTVSIGVALSKRGDTTSTLLQRADLALYRAKEQGRNRVVTETARATGAAATGNP